MGYIEEHRSNFPFGDNFTKVGVLVDDKIPSTTSGIPQHTECPRPGTCYRPHVAPQLGHT